MMFPCIASIEVQDSVSDNLSIIYGAEHAVHPREVVADGAGCLLAESCKGVANGLHSKAPQLLALAMQLDLLSAAKINAKVCLTTSCDTIWCLVLMVLMDLVGGEGGGGGQVPALAVHLDLLSAAKFKD